MSVLSLVARDVSTESRTAFREVSADAYLVAILPSALTAVLKFAESTVLSLDKRDVSALAYLVAIEPSALVAVDKFELSTVDILAITEVSIDVALDVTVESSADTPD